MNQAIFRRWLVVAIVATVAIAPVRQARAQLPDSATTPVRLEAFVKAHIALAELRSKSQAELADPKTKKSEAQATARERLLLGSQRILKEFALTETEFAQLTKRVSSDDALRKDFDALVTRLTGGKGTP